MVKERFETNSILECDIFQYFLFYFKAWRYHGQKLYSLLLILFFHFYHSYRTNIIIIQSFISKDVKSIISFKKENF